MERDEEPPPKDPSKLLGPCAVLADPLSAELVPPPQAPTVKLNASNPTSTPNNLLLRSTSHLLSTSNNLVSMFFKTKEGLKMFPGLCEGMETACAAPKPVGVKHPDITPVCQAWQVGCSGGR